MPSVNLEANEALSGDNDWAIFVETLVDLLQHSSTWQVTCESDCDQSPLTLMRLAPAGLAGLLGSFRAERPDTIAIRATPLTPPYP